MKDILNLPPWDQFKKEFCDLNVPTCDFEREKQWFVIFWQKVLCDLMAVIKSAEWDCIECTVRPEDGHISFYFWNSSLNRCGPMMHICLSSASLEQSAELRWEEEEKGVLTGAERHAQDLAEVVRYAKALVEAAGKVGLDHACGKCEHGLKMRFHHYDNEPPLYETDLRT